MQSIHEILRNFGVAEKEARRELTDTLMMVTLEPTAHRANLHVKDITMCYMLYALCCHFHYSLADVLRMSSFTIVVHAEYDHELPMSEINR